MESLESAVDKLLEIIKAAGPDIKQADVDGMALGIYQGVVGQYRPLIQMIPSITQAMGKDAAPVIVALLTLANSLTGDRMVKAAAKVFQTNRARARFVSYKAHKDAGFTMPEAMAFVLQDAASSGNAALLKGVAQNARKSSSS
jgi:hypothetical protein